MPKIAILLPDLRGGGVERVRLLLSQAFLDRGYQVDLVLARLAGDLVSAVPSRVSIVDLKAPRIRNALMPLVAYLRKNRPDMLLSAMWPWSGIGVMAAKLSGTGCHTVVSEHNALSKTPAYRGLAAFAHRSLGRFVYSAANGVVCVSEGVRNDLRALTGLREERMRVIYNPVRSPDAGAEREADHELLAWWSAGEGRLVAAGTLKPQKDYPTMLRALSLVRRERDARLLILGGGEKASLEELIGELGLGEAVRLAGFVEDPYPYFEAADLFVLTSAWEGLGNVIIEALACGTPVVSTDCPSGPAEILDNGRYGRLVSVGDAAALASAIIETLIAPSDSAMLRARGAEFSIDRAADQYLALLDPERPVSTGRLMNQAI